MENSDTCITKESTETLEMKDAKKEVKSILQPGNNDAFMNAYTVGIELMKNNTHQPSIIFIATHDNHVIEAFELNVSDNSVKHLNPARFVITNSDDQIENDDTKNEVKKPMEYIFIRSKSLLTKIKIKDILYIQAFGDYINIFAADKRYTLHSTLKAVEEKLPAGMFYRVHRSYLVALDHIDNVEENTAYIGKHPIAISEQFRKELLNKLNLI
jgi:two-component system LytT family response regulator